MKATVSEFYKKLFGSKVYKISLDAGCTCPTRDGTKGYGGCIFCSANGSGDFVPSKTLTISQQVEEAKLLVAKKTKTKYIVYFQNFTNTYGDLGLLAAKWREALSCEGVTGLALGTRPDCISEECLCLLADFVRQGFFVQLELGFQTSNEASATYIRRGFSNDVYFDAVARIHKMAPAVHVVTHVIFGLPGETEEDMMKSVRAAVEAGTDGIKIMCLYVLEDTDLALEYEQKKFEVLGI